MLLILNAVDGERAFLGQLYSMAYFLGLICDGFLFSCTSFAWDPFTYLREVTFDRKILRNMNSCFPQAVKHGLLNGTDSCHPQILV